MLVVSGPFDQDASFRAKVTTVTKTVAAAGEGNTSFGSASVLCWLLPKYHLFHQSSIGLSGMATSGMVVLASCMSIMA